MKADKMIVSKDKTAFDMKLCIIPKIDGYSWCKIFFFTGIVLTITSCINEGLCNAPCPDNGAIQITTDWSGISEDAVCPDNYLLRIGDITQLVSGVENNFKEPLPEDKYTLLVQNTPFGITVGNSYTAIVNTLANGTLEPMPEYLFFAVKELNVRKDEILKVHAKMRQSIRKLTLVLKIKTVDTPSIASFQASLSGIAHTLDLTSGSLTEAQKGKSVIPVFEKVTIARTTETNAYASTLKLLGVVTGEKQLLSIDVAMADGRTIAVSSDLTEQLKYFSADINPFTLYAELVLSDDKVEGVFEGTITGWKEVNNGDITIH